MPAEFWHAEQLREAFAAQHIGRVARAYRLHPYHHAVYGPGGISQGLLGQWLGVQQPQISRIENGPPIRDLDTLAYWARTLRIPAEMLWFDLPGSSRLIAPHGSMTSAKEAPDTSPSVWLPSEDASYRTQIAPFDPLPADLQPDSETAGGLANDPQQDRVLSASWTHRGTVTASIALSGGSGPMKRRRFALLTGAALTGSAHQWLIRDPEPLVSGLTGSRIGATLVDQLPGMITTLRAMDDAAGGGTVLPFVEQAFGWVAGLLDQASYDERTGQKLHVALAELGQLTGWAAHDAGQPGLGQRYHVTALHAAHSADDQRLGAHILGCMADQAARHGQPAEAVTLIDSALVGVRGHHTPRLLAELYIRKAYALATLQDQAACTVAVVKARSQIEHFTPDSDPTWLYWVTPAEITAGAGDCLLQVGQAAQAAALLGEAIALLDKSFARDRQIYLIHLADALARPGKQCDLDVAADQGLVALKLVATLASTRGVECLRDLYAQLQPHALVPAVGDFLEQARGVLAA